MRHVDVEPGAWEIEAEMRVDEQTRAAGLNNNNMIGPTIGGQNYERFLGLFLVFFFIYLFSFDSWKNNT